MKHLILKKSVKVELKIIWFSNQNLRLDGNQSYQPAQCFDSTSNEEKMCNHYAHSKHSSGIDFVDNTFSLSR